MRFLGVIVFVVATASSGAAQSRLTLPDSGLSYSPDSSLVAFAKSTPERMITVGMGPTEATELWVARGNGTAARRLLIGKPSEDMKYVIANMHSMAFSTTGRDVYFLSSAWVTSDALHVVDVATGQEHFVAAANSLEVIRAGEYSGCLLVEQHRYWLAGGSYDWVWLLTETGREIGPVVDARSPDAESRMTEFRLMFVTDSVRKGGITRTASPDARCSSRAIK